MHGIKNGDSFVGFRKIRVHTRCVIQLFSNFRMSPPISCMNSVNSELWLNARVRRPFKYYNYGLEKVGDRIILLTET